MNAPMHAPVKPRRDHVVRTRSSASIRAEPAVVDPKTLAPPQRDHAPEERPDQRVDPLWMISAAGAILFVFLALAIAFD